MFDLKKALITIATVLVGGIAVWLTAGGGASRVLEWFQPAIIEATSTTRRIVDAFMAGEPIRFYLKNVKSERVFWVFDERTMHRGNIEFEYAFPFEGSLPIGLARDHRVDAFYKYGASYGVASEVVRVHNVQHSVSLNIESSAVKVQAATVLAERWMLERASITKFKDGNFEPKGYFTMTEQPDKKIASGVISAGKLFHALSYPGGGDLKTELARKKDAWVTYEFVDRDGKERLSIVHPLSAVENKD